MKESISYDRKLELISTFFKFELIDFNLRSKIWYKTCAQIYLNINLRWNCSVETNRKLQFEFSIIMDSSRVFGVLLLIAGAAVINGHERFPGEYLLFFLFYLYFEALSFFHVISLFLLQAYAYALNYPDLIEGMTPCVYLCLNAVIIRISEW